MTLSDCLAAYEDDLRVRAKPSSRRIAAVHCRTILRHLHPTTYVTEMSRADVNSLVEDLRFAGQQDTSINGVLRVLRAALRLQGANAVVRLLKEVRKIPHILTAEDVRHLADVAAGPEGRLAILLAAHAGLRHSEIAHLDWDDLEGGVVRVRAKRGWCPKAHAEREVPMNETLREAVDYHRRNCRDRSPFTGVTFTGEVRAAFQAAGLYIDGTKPGLHMLRRTFASRLLGAGVDIETVRELGGWADLTTVQRYVASTTDLKRAAVEKL